MDLYIGAQSRMMHDLRWYIGWLLGMNEGDFAIVISWATKKERGPWKFDGWFCQIIDISSELGCFFSWGPCLSNHVIDALAKCEARNMVSFVGDFYISMNYS